MKTMRVALALSFLFCFEPNFASAGGLLGAVATVDVTPPIGTPVGGFGGGSRRLKFPFNIFGNFGKYATIFKPSEGVRDPIRAKVMLIRNGSKKLLFVSLDTVGVSEEVYLEILSRLAPLGYQPDEVFISATHTHSGPGTLSNNLIWEVAVMDFYQPDIFEKVVGGITSAVLQAESSLQPAQLLSYIFTAQDIQINRRDKPGHFDPNANVMVLKSDAGAWLGGMVNLAVHGTALDAKNLHFSADVPGNIERQMENRFTQLNQNSGISQPAGFLFVNGAEGDVAPKYGQSDGIEVEGTSFADQAIQGLPNARVVSPDWSVHSMRIDLGEPAMTLAECAGTPSIFKALKIGLGAGILSQGLPRTPRFSLLRLGDMAFISWPGEPTTTLGLEVKAAFYANPAIKQVWLMGLTNGYVAYFTSMSEFFEGTYESCSSMYGPNGGDRVVEEFVALSQMSQ